MACSGSSGTEQERALAAAGLAAIAGMLAAGLFEYNFGDSEFLMLFLVLVTLPFAAARRDDAAAALAPERAREIAAARGRRQRPRRRRRHARQVHRRPRDAHLAGGAGPGRRVRSRDAPHRRRRQRGAQRHRARRAGDARRRHRPGRGGRDAGPGLPRGRHRAVARRRRQPVRRRPRCASSPTATSRSRGSTTRCDAEIAGEIEERIIAEHPRSTRRRVRDRRVGLPEGMRHRDG